LFLPKLQADLIFKAWMFAAMVSAIAGLVQYFGWASVLSPWVAGSAIGEAFANLRQRNQFATLLSIGLAALTGWLAQRPPGRSVPLWAYFLALLLALGNAASGSRTGLLQWLLLVLLATAWSMRSRRPLQLFGLQVMLAYLIAVITLPWLLAVTTGVTHEGLLGRFGETSSCSSRWVLWSNVLTLIAQKPWLGWGWGELDYAHYMAFYDGPRFCEILDNAHNLPLHLAVELGIPAALAVCGGFVWWVIRQRPWRETDPTRQMAWGVLAVILLHSMLEYPLWYGPFQMAFGLSLGLLWGGRRVQASPLESPPEDVPVSIFQALAATILIAIVGYAGWDYHRISQIYLAPEARDAAYRDDTLPKIRDSWLFRDQVRFAELTITPLTRDNAQWTFDTARVLLHYSPEPRIIEKVIESAVMLGRDDEALMHLARYRAAFPEDHARWVQEAAAAPERLPHLK
jgi:O-antigen ligase